MGKKARSCGSCSLCCTALEIESQPGYSTRLDNGEDVAKAAGEACRFLSAQGCQIYSVRPIVCREFACDWLLGKKGLKDKDYPLLSQKIGVRGTMIESF